MRNHLAVLLMLNVASVTGGRGQGEPDAGGQRQTVAASHTFGGPGSLVALAGSVADASDRDHPGPPSAAPGRQQRRVPNRLVLTGTLPNRISESSGVAVSRRFPGILWTHNDSGHGPRVYAVDSTGDIKATFEVRGASAQDWEDIALGPCLTAEQGESCLYIADTGDNDGRRRTTHIYIVAEPDPAGARNKSASTDRALRVRIRLSRGPADVEALAVTKPGDVLLFTKGREGRSFVYRAERERLRIAQQADEPLLLEAQGSLSLEIRNISRLVTGAAVSPDGRRLVVRTYAELFFYRLGPDLLQLEGPPCFLGAAEPQGEAVDFLDDQDLVLMSESLLSRPATIYAVRCD